MKLVKLNNIIKYNKQSVYIYELSSSFFKEVNYSSAEFCLSVAGIFDDNKRAQDVLKTLNYKVEILPTKSIKKINWDNALLLITSDYFNEAFEKIQNICEEASCKDESFFCPDTVYYYVNKETEVELSYRDKYKDTKLENIIVFRSGPHESQYVKGCDFSDNARALFEYMLSVDLNEKYELIWFVKNPDEYAQWSKEYKNVKFISFDDKSDEYYDALFTAKYIFMTDAYGFARNCREDQIRIQLWHGCGFKTRVNFSRCEQRYEYNIVVSDVYKNIHKRIYGLRDDQVIITGYPKQDWLRKPYDRCLQEILGIKKTKKVIFWLPTFRMADDKLKELNQYELSTETTLPIVATYQQLEELNELLEKEDIFIVIKFHPFIKKDNIKNLRYSNIIGLSNEELVKDDLIINRLLASADALISDYSSVAVDFLSLDRPIAFTLDDVEEYQNSRGFVYDKIQDWLPGKMLLTYEDFKMFIYEIANNIDSSYKVRQEIGSKMNWFHDGNNCKRLIDYFRI